MLHIRAFLLSTWLFFLLTINAVAQSLATGFEHPDNLMITHRLGCISLEEVTNKYTPADLSRAVEKCAKRGNYEQAIQLFFLYSVYGYYDQRRMKDASAGSAISVLNSNIFQSIPARRRDGMGQAAQQLQDESGPLFIGTCSTVNKIGPPDYIPIYMAAHGLGAISVVDEKVTYLSRRELSQMIADIDVARLWDESLFEANGCPK